jgi:predicted MFS family arabinose efflux permease
MSSFKRDFSNGSLDDKGDPAISPGQVSLIVSILSVGTVMGSIFAAPAGDYWGRRLSLIGSICIFFIGVLFQVLASSLPLLLVGRFVAGLFFFFFFFFLIRGPGRSRTALADNCRRK